MPTSPAVPEVAKQGLNADEVATRLANDGPNILPVTPSTPAWRRLASEMVHFFAIVLWVAGTLAFVAGLPQLGVAIYIVVILNGTFAFVQERRAEHAALRLRDLLPRFATVVRDGAVTEVPADGLVVGDVVRLQEGDRISADLRIDRADALSVDTSMLTGESVSAHPDIGETAFAGCFVTEGEGTATVTATGSRTRLAGIAGLTQAQRPEVSPLHRELGRVSRLIAVVAVAIGVVFFLISLLVGTPATNGFLFAVGVSVALVPEGLLPTVTLSLAIGAQRMAKRHALVRHLEAVETLGSTTFICTDKTGTLTCNQMAVVEVWMTEGWAHITGQGYEPDAEIDIDDESGTPALAALARAATRCSSGRAVRDEDGAWIARGDPMEAALHALSLRVGFDEAADRASSPDCARFPFDPRRRRMSVVAGSELLVKGAPDAIFPLVRLPPQATDVLRQMASRGLRVLAVASRTIDAQELTTTEVIDAEQIERSLTLLGLVGLEDPPRESAAAAITACRDAGIGVAMITGDHPATALAIACEVGLSDPNERPLLGGDLPADEAELAALVGRDGAVVARVSPEEKLRIARALGAHGHIVAMTGDGVNDAPALREAAIGVAMGRSGTDVAREAADLVLLDDDFATIIAAIEQGRSTFANIRRFLTYHLTDNVAELTPFVVWALSGGRFPLALGVLQVLALDIGTDILPALALGAEPPAPHVLDQPPIERHLLDRRLFFRAFGVLGPTEAVVELTAFIVTFLAVGWRPGDPFPEGPVLLAASGAAFTAVVLGQLANAFACRSTTRPVWAIGWTSNPLLLWAVSAEVVMLLGFLFIGPLAEILGHAPPTAAGFAVAVLAIPAIILADSAHKALVRRRSP